MSHEVNMLHELIDEMNQRAHELAQDGYRVEVDVREVREVGYHTYPVLFVSVLKPVVPQRGAP